MWKMMENDIYALAIKKLFSRLDMKDTGFDIHVASYLIGVMDVINIIMRNLEDQACIEDN